MGFVSDGDDGSVRLGYPLKLEDDVLVKNVVGAIVPEAMLVRES